MALRYEVFVREQDVPIDLERDGLDAGAEHVVVYVGERCVGTGRMIPKANEPGTIKMQRIAVADAWRGRGVGRVVMAELEAKARDLGFRRLLLASQQEAVGFYQRLGYRRFGDMFMDAGIPHYWMDKAVQGDR